MIDWLTTWRHRKKIAWKWEKLYYIGSKNCSKIWACYTLNPRCIGIQNPLHNHLQKGLFQLLVTLFRGCWWPPTIGDEKVTAAESPGSLFPPSQSRMVTHQPHQPRLWLRGIPTSCSFLTSVAIFTATPSDAGYQIIAFLLGRFFCPEKKTATWMPQGWSKWLVHGLCITYL